MAETNTQPPMSKAEEQELDSLFGRWQNDPAERARIDAQLAEAEARGGELPHDKVFARIATRLKALKA